MKAAERREEIVELLHSSRMHVDDLSAYFGVSGATIRRDLASLSADGRIARTYGGALVDSFSRETSLSQRLQQHPAQKSAIAAAATGYLPERGLVVMDSGSTVAALAKRVRSRAGLTVLTNNIAVAQLLLDCDAIDLVMLGGRLRRPSQAFVGTAAERMLAAYTVDTAFIGAEGYLQGKGICDRDEQQLTLKQTMIEAAAQVCLLLDSTKLGIRPSSRWLEIEREFVLITDSGISEEQRSVLDDDPRIRLVIAEQKGPHTAG